MEQDFYKGRLRELHNIDVLVPDADARETIHRVIYQELCQGKIDSESRTDFLAAIDQLTDNGAQAMILGCTEIGMLVKQADTPMRLYDTTAIHAESALRFALAK